MLKDNLIRRKNEADKSSKRFELVMVLILFAVVIGLTPISKFIPVQRRWITGVFFFGFLIIFTVLVLSDERRRVTKYDLLWPSCTKPPTRSESQNCGGQRRLLPLRLLDVELMPLKSSFMRIAHAGG